MEDNLTNEEFLLSLDFAHEAFIQLSKKKGPIDKEELIKEIERLMIEDIQKQIKGRKGHQPTEEVIHKRLRKVMNPLSGLDLERTNLVKDVQLNDGLVRIKIDLPPDHQFASSIREEIKEKIEPLWDIKEVIIDFVE